MRCNYDGAEFAISNAGMITSIFSMAFTITISVWKSLLLLVHVLHNSCVLLIKEVIEMSLDILPIEPKDIIRIGLFMLGVIVIFASIKYDDMKKAKEEKDFWDQLNKI